jgi:hypothetical protein
MAEDSESFRTAAQLRLACYQWDPPKWHLHSGAEPSMEYAPLYEAKMIHLFDHRWGTYDNDDIRDVIVSEKEDPGFEPRARYWVPAKEVRSRLESSGWTREWLIGWRDITSAHVFRTLIASALPVFGSGDTILLIFPSVTPSTLSACLLVSRAE